MLGLIPHSSRVARQVVIFHEPGNSKSDAAIAVLEQLDRDGEFTGQYEWKYCDITAAEGVAVMRGAAVKGFPQIFVQTEEAGISPFPGVFTPNAFRRYHRSRTAALEAGAGKLSRPLQQPAPPKATASSEPTSIRDWLDSVNPSLAVYAEALHEYGFENVHLLTDATEEDLAESLADIKMKKPHQRTVKKAFAALKAAEKDEL